MRHQGHQIGTEVPGCQPHRTESPIHARVQRQAQHQPVYPFTGLLRLPEPHLHRHRPIRTKRL
jgi:hypothetical protein